MEKTLTIRVAEDDLRLWKEAAWERRMSLSSWVRELCSAASGGVVVGGLGAGGPGGASDRGGTASRPAPAPSSFRPDPKVKK